MSSDVLEIMDSNLAMPEPEDAMPEPEDAMSTEDAIPKNHTSRYTMPSPIREHPALEFGEPEESFDSELDDITFDDLFDTSSSSSLSSTVEMQEVIDNYEARIAELSSNLEECQRSLESVSEVERQLKEFEDGNTTFFENIATLRDTCSDLQNACAEKDKQIEELEAEVASLREILTSYDMLDSTPDTVIPETPDYLNAKIIIGDKVDIDAEVNSESGNIVNVPYMNQNLQSVRRTIPARTEQVTNIKNIIS